MRKFSVTLNDSAEQIFSALSERGLSEEDIFSAAFWLLNELCNETLMYVGDDKLSPITTDEKEIKKDDLRLLFLEAIDKYRKEMEERERKKVEDLRQRSTDGQQISQHSHREMDEDYLVVPAFLRREAD